MDMEYIEYRTKMKKCPNPDCDAEGFFVGDEQGTDWWKKHEEEPPVFMCPQPGSLKDGEEIKTMKYEYACYQCRERFPPGEFLPVGE